MLVHAAGAPVSRGLPARAALRTPVALAAGVCAVCCACLSVFAADDEHAAALALVREDEAGRVEMLARVTPAVVCIYADRAGGSGGSGVVIDPAGHGLTNYHVVAPLLESRRGYGGLSDGRLYPLKVLGIDPGGDVAMFKLEGRERFDHVALGDSDELRVGQRVAALGNPFALAEDYTPTITLGVVSGLHRYQYGQADLLEYADCIQVSTSINPGNSGGPLFDLAGRVVGIVGRASFEERGRVNVGLGYAVTINQIKRFLPALRAGRLCRHGTLGATVELAGDDLICNAIQDLSPAEQAGIQLGDVLLSIDGSPVRTANEYNNLIATLPAEWPVSIGLRRGEKELTVRVRLEPLPLRDLPLFVPDPEQTQAEVRPLFELYEQGARQAAGSGGDAAGPFTDAIDAARARVVKLYGATIGREKAYASGVLISPDGRIVTALSVLLEGRSLRAVLADGRTFPARVVARDEQRQLGLLKIDAADLPFFELSDSHELEPGDWVIAAANPFKVAEGPEPVSVSVGVLSARTKLTARRRTQDFPYHGPALLTDLIVSTPGSAGGALVDADGRLVGVIGKAVTSKHTNTWLNYALPVEEVAAFVTGGDARHTDAAGATGADNGVLTAADLGLRLFDIGGRVRPAYVERVRPDSPAWRAGLRPNDLIVSLDGQPVATCAELERLIAQAGPKPRLSLLVKRGEELKTLDLSLEQPPK